MRRRIPGDELPKPSRTLPALSPDDGRAKRASFASRYKNIIERSAPEAEPPTPSYEPSIYGDRDDDGEGTERPRPRPRMPPRRRF